MTRDELRRGLKNDYSRYSIELIHEHLLEEGELDMSLKDIKDTFTEYKNIEEYNKACGTNHNSYMDIIGMTIIVDTSDMVDNFVVVY